MTAFSYSKLPSRLSWIHLVARGDALVAVAFDDGWEKARDGLARRFDGAVELGGAVPPSISNAIEAYFANRVHAIDELPVQMGGTEFQERVWQHLRTIEAGTTTTYGAVARALGDANATRAVGTANGANPIPIVVPCHRVIAADGRMHGYSAGIKRKQWLLEHEGALSPLFRHGGVRINIEPMD